jgi:hypothetical protein
MNLENLKRKISELEEYKNHLEIENICSVPLNSITKFEKKIDFLEKEIEIYKQQNNELLELLLIYIRKDLGKSNLTINDIKKLNISFPHYITNYSNTNKTDTNNIS